MQVQSWQLLTKDVSLPSNWQIIDDDLPDDSFVVDNEKSSGGMSGIF